MVSLSHYRITSFTLYVALHFNQDYLDWNLRMTRVFKFLMSRSLKVKSQVSSVNSEQPDCHIQEHR